MFKNDEIFSIGIFAQKSILKSSPFFGAKIQIPISSKQKMGRNF